MKEDKEGFSAAISLYDSSIDLAPKLAKIPTNVQERWAAKANDYKKKHIVGSLPFTAFVEFIGDQTTIRNDPCLRTAPTVIENNLFSTEA
ncbi:hypothetical protein DPMN_192002 [Dreissena polymorpha]|uniref:Uncharacterized protein n=1 Tax=Dreissena polymorpha TaxID=45954 RepID=A0A9D3XZ67_DREPO|nr:hypothetical protein DPMN_192002 [Dreissena polymorpha]